MIPKSQTQVFKGENKVFKVRLIRIRDRFVTDSVRVTELKRVI